MLEQKIVLITGATRGIGFAIAKVFAKAGARVILNGRDNNRLDKVVNDIAKYATQDVDRLCFDVSDPQMVKEGFQALFKMTKGLDVLVNNAGVLDDALLGMVTPEQIERVYGVNAFSALYCSQYAARLMQRRKGGSIINVSSIIGVNGNEGQAVYGSSKAALIGMTKSLAKELAPSNIRVNAIAPGFIDTDMARSIPDEIFQQRLDSIKMGRIGKPEEVANTALFLASNLSSYVTGQVIGVDGGMLI
jgi:3-oxoacyl-[acyl-carrier protein] reductase